MEWMKKEQGQLITITGLSCEQPALKWRKEWAVCCWTETPLYFQKTKLWRIQVNDHLSKKLGSGFKSEAGSLPGPTCVSIWPWPFASTSLICICRYTCTLHCIVMLLLLCKDFYCYLLKIFSPQPCNSSMDKLLGADDFFLLSISSKGNAFIHLQPPHIELYTSKIPLQKLYSCSWGFSETSLISWLEGLLLKLREWLYLSPCDK